ncbi:MAG: tRNA preQ1(34) S-adenosylmethionine ribosyltransferase-isomerase QueA [Planctomycetota bacterium]|jgi:S-adenosylmethionine:tRNA ribosyltransferase-isomerase
MKASDFDYELPPERIAQEPLAERDASRLLVLDRSSGEVSHHVFRELPSLLDEGDLVILNDTRVVPARLHGLRERTGGRVEALFLSDLGGGRWLAFTKSGGKLRAGEWLKLAGGRVRARIAERRGEEGDVLAVESERPLDEVLEETGHMPVPPYIHRDRAAPPSALDRERYQTTYARHLGAVAAPTAGLHFTEAVFERLDARGVGRAFVTLHVGPGTFRPVKVDDVEAHTMDAERYTVPPETARAVRECRERGGRVVAVGTTTVRTLESAAGDDRTVREGPGVATLFITPGYGFRVADALVTNFHLPRGTPLMLTCAFAGRERVFAAYAEALEEGYRFLSYGDAMLVL